MVARSELSLSANQDEEAIIEQATALIDNGRWHLCLNGAGLERDFKFKTFKSTWAFMTEIAEECKRQKHHPEWTNVFNRTSIRWTTHSPKGMSGKDLVMARFCDEVGERYGEQLPAEREEAGKKCGCEEGKGKV